MYTAYTYLLIVFLRGKYQGLRLSGQKSLQKLAYKSSKTIIPFFSITGRAYLIL